MSLKGDEWLKDLPLWRMNPSTSPCALIIDSLLEQLDNARKELKRHAQKEKLLEDRLNMLIARLEQAREDLRECEEGREADKEPPPPREGQGENS
jgi:hypothetical protein